MPLVGCIYRCQHRSSTSFTPPSGCQWEWRREGVGGTLPLASRASPTSSRASPIASLSDLIENRLSRTSSGRHSQESSENPPRIPRESPENPPKGIFEEIKSGRSNQSGRKNQSKISKQSQRPVFCFPRICSRDLIGCQKPEAMTQILPA